MPVPVPCRFVETDRTRIDSARLRKLVLREAITRLPDPRLRKLTACTLITKMGPSFRASPRASVRALRFFLSLGENIFTRFHHRRSTINTDLRLLEDLWILHEAKNPRRPVEQSVLCLSD